jgi:hypothetical protein
MAAIAQMMRGPIPGAYPPQAGQQMAMPPQMPPPGSEHPKGLQLPPEIMQQMLSNQISQGMQQGQSMQTRTPGYPNGMRGA